MSYRVKSIIALAYAMLAMISFTGCTALSSTTEQATKATVAISHGVTYVSKATGNASVTEPDVPRYASAAAFVRSQRLLLARQAASGGGEDIDALALLLDTSDNRDLGRWMQKHYEDLFGDSASLSAQGLVARIDAHEG